MQSNYNGIKFYSSADLSSGYSLDKAESILKSFSIEDEYTDINRVIELFNIKKFIDDGMHMQRWSDDDFNYYKRITEEFDPIIAIFFASINDENFLQLLEDVDMEYSSDFWFLVSRFKVYKKISKEVFNQALDLTRVHLWDDVLQQKDIVNAYGQVIADCMTKSTGSACLLMAQFLENKRFSQDKLWFPKELTGEMREAILLDYIASDDANPNYLKLIVESQSSLDLPLSDKTRLEARRKYDAYWKAHFEENNGLEYGMQVGFSKDQEDVVCSDSKDRYISLSYSKKWIEENQDYATLLNNFLYLFEYTDSHFRSHFVFQPAQSSTLMRSLGIKGNREYETGTRFKMMHDIFSMQMTGYYKVLLDLKIRLENLFKWFFEEYLDSEFSAKGFAFSVPSESATDLEKCKLLATEIDSVLKQFELFVDDGCIDRELFEMSSKPIKLGGLPSFCKEKYIYPKNDVCKNSMHLLFSDQSHLCYTEKTKSNYSNFFSIVQNEMMSIDDFKEYQKPNINWLAQQDCINVGTDGILTLNFKKATMLKDLYNNQVSCLQYLERFRDILDDMVKADEVQYKTSLFSKPEQDYINFVLNKAEFSNGYDLRNKYVHGTHSMLQAEHQKDYIELLKIMVLIIIKINEEFCLRDEQKVAEQK